MPALSQIERRRCVRCRPGPQPPDETAEYKAGLHALIRDPKSVRSWPAQKMNGLPPDLQSDREIDLIIGYLKHMAGRKVVP